MWTIAQTYVSKSLTVILTQTIFSHGEAQITPCPDATGPTCLAMRAPRKAAILSLSASFFFVLFLKKMIGWFVGK